MLFNDMNRTRVFHIGDNALPIYGSESWVSTETLSNVKMDGQRLYAEATVVPNIRNIDKYDATASFVGASFRAGYDILVGNFSGFNQEILELTRQSLELPSEVDPGEFFAHFSNLSEPFVQFVRSISVEGSDIVSIEPLVSSSDLFTTTFKTNQRELKGLHYDNLDPGQSDLRYKRCQRITVNLSTEERIFMFSDIPLDELRLPMDRQISVSELFEVNDYFPKINIKYLRLPPLTYCIAPTENLLHDGSTVGCRKMGIAMSVLFYPDVKCMIDKR